MSAARSRKTRRDRRFVHPGRAVIDIGSNTVRLVIYEGPERAPETVWNEKVAARLGRDLATNGRIPQHAENEALGALARYATIIDDLGIDDVQTVATAAARDATNGAEFLKKVAKLGLEPRLLSGREEARASALGAIGAFPGAEGVVADLGGGSLELVAIGGGDCHHGESLPLGTLRMPALRQKGGFRKKIRKAFRSVGWAQAHPGPLYMVGGTWRALAAYAMHSSRFPLTDPHGFELEAAEAAVLARKLVRAKPQKLMTLGGITPMRAEYLPDAAALLRVMLDEFGPDRLVFSSWGLREGLLFDRLDPLQRSKDPLIAAISAFAGLYEISITEATRFVGWSVETANGGGRGNERLRLAAALLAMALQRVEPNLRRKQALEWALDKRWIAIDARGRAMICAALLGSLGRTEMPPQLLALADEAELREGTSWGLGYRLARRMGAGSSVSLTKSRLMRRKRKLVLELDHSRAALAHYPLTLDLEILAGWLGLEPKIEVAAQAAEDSTGD